MPSKYRGSAAEMAALNMFITFMRAHAHLSADVSPVIARHKLTNGQFGVLETLWHLGPMRQCDLGAKNLTSKPNVTELVRNLEKNGLVSRDADPDDRRAQVVTLTPKGRSLITKAFPDFVDHLTRSLSGMSSAEMENLRGLTKRMGLQLAERASRTRTNLLSRN